MIGNDLRKAKDLIAAMAERADVARIDTVDWDPKGGSFARVVFFRPGDERQLVIVHYGPGCTTMRFRTSDDEPGTPVLVTGALADGIRTALEWLCGTRGEGVAL